MESPLKYAIWPNFKQNEELFIDLQQIQGLPLCIKICLEMGPRSRWVWPKRKSVSPERLQVATFGWIFWQWAKIPFLETSFAVPWPYFPRSYARAVWTKCRSKIPQFSDLASCKEHIKKHGTKIDIYPTTGRRTTLKYSFESPGGPVCGYGRFRGQKAEPLLPRAPNPQKVAIFTLRRMGLD